MLAQLSYLQSTLDKTIEHYKSELNTLRSGRVSPALVEHIKVDAYGTLAPLIELASINAPEPRLIVIQPWDKTIIKNIEKSLQSSNLGAMPVIDGSLVRLNFPALTEERRRELVKQVGAKAEQAKIAVRNGREETLKKLKSAKDSGELSEDNFFVSQKELQKMVDEYNEHIKKLAAVKEKEIMAI